MATKGEILREYKIKINTEIGQAKKEVEGLRTAMGKKLGDNIGTEIEASMEAAEASLKSLSDTVDKRIGEMNSSLRGLKLDKLQSEMKELSDSVKESVSVVKEQVDLLTTAFNSSDPARFEQFVAKITSPLADLTAAIKTATIAINGLSDVKLKAPDTSNLDKTVKKVSRAKKIIQDELKAAAENVAPIRLTYDGKLNKDKNIDRNVIRNEMAALRNLIDLYNEAKRAGINANKFLSDAGVQGDISEVKDYYEKSRERLNTAGKKQKPIDLNVRLKATFDAKQDIDDDSVKAYIDNVKEQLIKRVQDAVKEEPIKLRFGWDIETDDVSKTGDKTGEILQDADKVLYKTLKIRMEGDESRLKSNLENIIERINSQIQGNDKFAIKVDIIPNDITKGSVLEKIMALGNVPVGTTSSGGKVSGEVTLQGAEGLATEGTLQEIRDILAKNSDGPKGPGTGVATKTAPVSSGNKNWNAAYSKVDAFRENGARNYAAFEDYHRIVNQEVEALRETILYNQKQFRFFAGLERDIIGDARGALGVKGIPEGKKTNIGKSRLYGDKITVDGQDFSTYARYSGRFKGRNVRLKEWQDYLDSLEESDLRELFKQMKKEAGRHRGSVQDTLRKNGVEYKWNKETKNWDQLATKASLGGDSNKSVVEKLRDQHREVVKGYEEEAAITARYGEILKERKTLAEDLVKLSEQISAGDYSSEDEYLVKQNRLRELTRTYKGNSESEQAESAEKFNRLIKEQRAILGKEVKTDEDYANIIRIGDEIKDCFGDVADIMLEAKRMLEINEETGKSNIDTMIEENEALFKRQKHTAEWASKEYLTRSKVVNPETAGGVFSVMRAATEHKTGMKDPGSYFSKATLKPFGDSATNLLKYLDSAEEYQADLDKIIKLSSRIAELERLGKYVPSGDGGRGTYESGLTLSEASALRRWRKERKEALARVATYDANRGKKELTRANIQNSLDAMSERGITVGNTSLTGSVKANYEKVYSKFIGRGSDMEQVIMEMTEEEFAEFKRAVTAAKDQIGDGAKEAVGKKVQDYEEHMLKTLQTDLDFAIKTLRSEEASPAKKLQAFDDARRLKEEIAYLSDPNAYIENNISLDDALLRYRGASGKDGKGAVLGAEQRLTQFLNDAGIHYSSSGPLRIPLFYRNLDEAIELADELGVKLDTKFSEMPEEYKKAFQRILGRDLKNLDEVKIQLPSGEKSFFKETNIDFMSAGSIADAQEAYDKAYDEYQDSVVNNLDEGVRELYHGLERDLYAAAKEATKAQVRGRLGNRINVDGKVVPEVAYNRHKLAMESFSGSQNGADKTVLSFAENLPKYEQQRADAAAEAARRTEEAANREKEVVQTVEDQIQANKEAVSKQKERIKVAEQEVATARDNLSNNAKDQTLLDFYDYIKEEQSISVDRAIKKRTVSGIGVKSGFQADVESRISNFIQTFISQAREGLLSAEEETFLKLMSDVDFRDAFKVGFQEDSYTGLPFSASDVSLAKRISKISAKDFDEKKLREAVESAKQSGSDGDVKAAMDELVKQSLLYLLSTNTRYLRGGSMNTAGEYADLFRLSPEPIATVFYQKKGVDKGRFLYGDEVLGGSNNGQNLPIRQGNKKILEPALEEVSRRRQGRLGAQTLQTLSQNLGTSYSDARGRLEAAEQVLDTERSTLLVLEEQQKELAMSGKLEKDRQTILSKYGQDALASAERIDALIAGINVLKRASDEVTSLEAAIKADEQKAWPAHPSPQYTQERNKNLENMKKALEEQRAVAERNQPNLLAMQRELLAEQERAKGLGLTVSRKTGRAFSSRYATRIGNIGLPTGNDESKYLTEAEQRGMAAMRKGVSEAKASELEHEKELNEQIDKLRWEAVDAQAEENKVAKARAALTEQEIKDLREASKYAGMTQEQADAAFELNEYNKKTFKEGKKPSGRQLWRQAYLQEAAERTGLKISKEGNAYLDGFDRDAWMRNPFAYKGNSYTDRIFDEYKPKEYQKALDSGLALEVTQKAVLNAINSLKTEGLALKDEKPADKKSNLPSPAPKGRKKGGKPRVEVPQEVKDAQKIFRDKEYKSFADFDDAAKEAAKKAILAGRNIYTYSSKKKPELNGKYGIASNLVGKNGFSDLTKDIAKQLGVELPDLDALRKAAEQKAVETKASAEAVAVEANATETLAEQMIAAAKAKKEFAEANNLVFDSAAESAPKVEEEAKAVEELAEKIEKLPQVDWNEISPEAQATIRAQFGENVDVYKQGTRGKNGEANVEYRVVGEDKAGVVSESGLLDQKRVLVLNAYSKAKLDAAKAARIENAEVKAGYDTELMLMKKKRKLQAENERLAITGKDPEMMVAKANAISAINNELEGVRKNLVANEELTKRNTRELEQYEKTLVGNAELAKGEKKVADRKAAEKKQRAAQNEADKATRKAQEETDKAAKKAQDEADKKAADKKKADEKEASKNDAETLKKFQEASTAHNKDAAATYKELAKSADEYLKLVDRSQAADFSDDERVRLSDLEEKWALASAAKRLYYLADLEKEGGLTQEQADELKQLRDFWGEATQEQRAYLIAADGTEASIKAVRDAMDGIDSANGKALENYFSSARDEAQKLLNILESIESGNYTEAFKNQARELKDSIFKIDESGAKSGFLTMLDSDAPLGQVMAQREMMRRQGAGVKAGMGSASNKAAKAISINSLLSSAQQTRKSYLGMPTELLNGYDSLIGRLKTLQSMQAKGIVSVEKVAEEAAALKALDAQLEASGRKTAGVFGTVTNRLTDMNAKFIAQYFSIQDWIRYMRTAVTTVVELDSALTELRKVSNETDERLAQSMRNSAKTATMLGSTITDVVNATADWARLGYNVDQAEELARVSILYKNVGDNIDIDTASSSLISTMKGYQLEADQAETIVDKFNEIGNNFAINSAEIGEALKRSAASFNASGTSLDKSIALVTAANTVAQNAESVGTTFKTLSARIRGASTELADLGEEEDEFTKTTSKLRDLVKSLTKFDIMEEDGKTFKDIYDILLGIGKEWNNLTDIERASLGEALAGKRNANVLYAVLQDTDLLESIYEKSLRSAGSAMREQENFQRSIQYSINQLKANGQALAQDFIETGLVKNVTSFLASTVEYLDQIVAKTGGLPAVTAAIMGAGSISAAGGLQNIYNGIRQGSLFSGKVYEDIIAEADDAAKDIVKGQVIGQKQVDKGFFASTGGALLTNLGISAITTLAVSAVTSTIKAVENAKSAATQSARELADNAAAAEEYSNSIEKLRGVLKDSNATESERATAKEKLLGIQNQLIDTYGKEAEKLDLINGNLDTQLDLIGQLSKHNAADWLEGTHKGTWLSQALGMDLSNRKMGEDANAFMTERGRRSIMWDKAGFKGLDGDVLASLRAAASKVGLSVSDYDTLYGGQSLYADNMTAEEFKEAATAFNRSLSELIANEYSDNEAVRAQLESFQNSVSTSLQDLSSSIATNKQNAIAYGLGLLATTNATTENGTNGFDLYSQVGDVVSEYSSAIAKGDVSEALQKSFDGAISSVNDFKEQFPQFAYIFDELIRTVTNSKEYKRHQLDQGLESRYGTDVQRLRNEGYTDVDASSGLGSKGHQATLNAIIADYEAIGYSEKEVIDHLVEIGILTSNAANVTDGLSKAYSNAAENAKNLEGIISSISSSGDLSGLDAEQNALLSHYEEQFLGLAQLRNKNLAEYAEALKSIQHYENQLDIDEKRQKAYSESTDIADYGEHGATQVVKVALDTEQATKELTEWLDSDAQYNIALTADIDLQADQVKEKLDAMGDAFSSIGDGWKVAKADVEDFVNYLPEAAAQAEVLADGSLQLNEEIVNSAHDRLNAEITAAEGGAMAEIESARAGLQAKIDAATAARNAARAMASAISHEESISAEDRKNYEEAVTNAKKTCYDTNQDNAITAAGTEVDAGKDVADNSDDNSKVMAANSSSAYTSMIGASADWARAAIANANAVAAATAAAANGDVVSGSVTEGYARNTYSGSRGQKNMAAQKAGLTDADTSMFDVLGDNASAAQYAAQAEAWDAYISNLTAGLATLNGAESKLKGARDALDKGFGNAGKDSGSGGGGGGGGGGSDKKDEKKEIDWMERMVNLLQKQHDLIKENADDEFLTYEKRIDATKQLIDQDEQLLGVYQKQAREYGVAYEKAYDEVRKLAGDDGKLKDLWDNDVYGLGASYEELKKVNDEINSVFEKYGKRNLDYNNRPYIAGEDGSWITMLTEGTSLTAGDKEFSMVITPILESGDEINLDEYLGKIQDQINEKMANGEEITIDTVLGLDKNNLIVSAAEGSWEQNAAAFDQMETELQGLKERAIELRFANEEGVKSLRDAVESGALDISQFSQEVQEAIMGVIEKYDKYQDSQKQVEKTRREQKQHEQEMFEMELNMIKERQKAIENERDIMQHSIDMREATGSEIIKESDYEDLIENSERLADNYREQLSVLEDQKASLDEGSAAWYNVVSQMYEVEGSLRDIEKQQAEWNETIKQLPIRRIQRYLQMLENIKKDIQNFNAEEQLLGINPNQQSYTDMFNIDVEALNKYKEELDKLRENLKTYTYGTDKFEETANSIQECEDSVSSLIQEMREYNTAILNIPIDKINEVVEKLEQIKSALEEVQADNDLAINAAITLLSEQIEDYNDKISETEKLYQDRIDALQEEADANAEQLALEKARYELERARGQLTNKILKNGEWTWTADVDQLKNAAESLDDATKNKAISDLEKERDAIIKPMQDEVERLEKLQDKWSKLEPDRENQLNYEKANPIFGDKNWQEKVLSGNDDALWNKMDQSYNQYLRSIDAYTEQIKDYQQTAQIMSTYIQEYNKGNLTASEVTAKMGMLMVRARDGYTSMDNLSDTLQAYKEVNATTALANSKPTVDALYKDFGSYMKIVEGQNATLDKYTQTWDQIHQSVQDQLAELKRLAEIEEQKLKEQRARASSGGGGSDGGNERSSDIIAVVSSGHEGEKGWSNVGGGRQATSGTYSELKDRGIIHHEGIKTGYVGHMNEDEQLRALDAMATMDLKKDEVPSLLQEGEVVLNKDQQDQLLKNLVPLDDSDMLSRFTLGKDVLNLNTFRAKKLKGGAFAGTGVQMQQNFTFGDIHVMEAQNVTDIAHGIMNGGLAQALTQQLYKR